MTLPLCIKVRLLWSVRGLLCLCCLLLMPGFFSSAGAQNPYDECRVARFIPSVTAYCSDSLEFGLTGSTASDNGFSLCQNTNGRDIWFTFYATAPDLVITVTPETGHRVDASLYDGACGSLTEATCGLQELQDRFLHLYKGGLEPGTQMFLRIDGGTSGDFRFTLCINNFFAPALDGSDCATANLICSGQSFTVNNVTGFGHVNELAGASCFNNANESNSIWFRWVCDTPGDFTFELIPLKESDDIDFVVYKVNGDPMGCNMEVVRCMATGVSAFGCAGSPHCCGPTGLRRGETDVSESAGCGPMKNNFLKPLDMEAGDAYALLINNYTSQNEGFEFRIDGTATLRNLKAGFDIGKKDGICREDMIILHDRTINSLGEINSVTWYFGPDAVPGSANGPGPVNVLFERSGRKTVSMIVENSAGCRSYAQDTLHVDCCGGALGVDLGADTIVEYGSEAVFDAPFMLEGHEIRYVWEPSPFLVCDTCAQAQLLPLYNDIDLRVEVMDEFGCRAEDMIRITMTVPEVFVPNVFSPNHDGINDVFMINSSPLIKSVRTLRVFDRWGALVYEGLNLVPGNDTDGWDGTCRGKDVSPGVYVYYLELETKGSQLKSYKGDVTLIR